MRFRSTVRLRLTLAFSALFLVSGMALLYASYRMVERRLPASAAFTISQGLDERDAEVARPRAASQRVWWIAAIDGAQIPTRDPAEVERLLNAAALSFRHRTLGTLVRQSGVALGLLSAASVALGWLVAGRVLRRLDSITRAAQRLSRDNLHERLALQGPHDELRRLADTFDAMLDRLQASFDAERRFAANASHELRTPLANQRTVLEVALADPAASTAELRAMGQRALDQVARQEVLCERLLLLARSSDAPLDQAPLDLASLTRDALHAVRPVGVTVGYDLRTAPVQGDTVLLGRLVENLLENAVHHNVDDGWVEVCTRVDNGTAQVRVRNSGPAIAPEEVHELFTPFHRACGERTGAGRSTGLGLSIVRTIVSRHHGQLQARALQGGGLEVIVGLPLARSAA